MGTKQPRFARHKGKGHGVLTNIAAVMTGCLVDGKMNEERDEKEFSCSWFFFKHSYNINHLCAIVHVPDKIECSHKSPEIIRGGLDAVCTWTSKRIRIKSQTLNL
ncbi:hypothetical protein Lal_00031987, partial [Lupinus albus]